MLQAILLLHSHPGNNNTVTWPVYYRLGCPWQTNKSAQAVLFNMKIIFSSVECTQFAVWGLGPAPSNPDYDDDGDYDDDYYDEPPVLKGQGA